MATAAIHIAGLVKTFGKHRAVDGLDLEVPQGSIFGFLGRNGAGKTTTIKILMNMLKPTAGAVEVLGQDPHVHEKELKERVGYISDNPVLYDWMKVEEVAWFAGQLYPRWDQQKVAATDRALRTRSQAEDQAPVAGHERPTQSWLCCWATTRSC